MTIDPRLYQKISGRSGDVTDAYGKALADQSARDSELNRAAYYEDIPDPKTNLKLAKIVIPVIVILVIASALFFR